jgi:hypothetical protein
MVHHNDYLDVIFRDAPALMARLRAESGEFTNQQFLKEAVRRSPGAYIDFLSAVKAERGEEFVFNTVHQAIGKRLSEEARRAGFVQLDGGRTELDIFGNPTDKVIYRRE